MSDEVLYLTSLAHPVIKRAVDSPHRVTIAVSRPALAVPFGGDLLKASDFTRPEPDLTF